MPNAAEIVNQSDILTRKGKHLSSKNNFINRFVGRSKLKLTRTLQSAPKQIPRKIEQGAKNVSNFRRGQMIYARQLRRPIVGSGIKKQGRGRPAGPSGRYYIPGVGPVGVYEYRKYFNQLMRERRAKAMGQLAQSRLSPEQQAALNSLQARQRAQQVNPENKVIPDTYGFVPTKSIHQQIDDFANEVP